MLMGNSGEMPPFYEGTHPIWGLQQLQQGSVSLHKVLNNKHQSLSDTSVIHSKYKPVFRGHLGGADITPITILSRCLSRHCHMCGIALESLRRPRLAAMTDYLCLFAGQRTSLTAAMWGASTTL